MQRNGLIIILTCLCLLFASQALAAFTPAQRLGKMLYFDKNLSMNQNQSCASCHHPSAKFSDPINARFPYDFPVSLGSDTTINGGRNAPTASYAAFIPTFHYDEAEQLFFGGQFLDGRADTLKDQAKGPFLNPVEMAMADEAAVIAALAKRRSYRNLFKRVYGINLTKIDTTTVNPEVLNAYDKMAEAIGEFEQVRQFSRFSSKYDYYLAGIGKLSAAEMRGLSVFEDPQLGNCAACHPSQPEVLPSGKLIPPMFTDFSYDNVGVPKSTNPMISDLPVDFGLGARTDLDSYTLIDKDVDGRFPSELGKFRVSSLRNIKKTRPYAHNGYFATLTDIVHFYNTRDSAAENWPAPEVTENVNIDELGELGLTPQQETDLVVFLKALTDRCGMQPPAIYALPVMTPLN